MIASSPDLALAERRETYERIQGALRERLAALRVILSERSHDGSISPELLVVTEGIAANLKAIDEVAETRFPLHERARTISEELRWLQADLIEEVDPLIDDAKFNIESAIDRIAPGTSTDENRKALRDESRKSEALFAINAQANLIIGLLGRLATVPSVEDLQETSNFLGEMTDQLELESKAIATWTDTVTIGQIAARLLAVSDPKTGLPAVKRAELEANARGLTLLAENRRLVTQLGALISLEVSRTEAIARRAAERSATAIAIGRNLLLAIAIASLAITSAIGWLYVRRHLVARLQELTVAATAIAEGQSAPQIPPATNDELGDLSRALAVFRQTRDDLVQSAKLAALGQMAAGISHELNQPLAAIRSHAHNGAILLDRGPRRRGTGQPRPHPGADRPHGGADQASQALRPPARASISTWSISRARSSGALCLFDASVLEDGRDRTARSCRQPAAFACLRRGNPARADRRQPRVNALDALEGRPIRR